MYTSNTAVLRGKPALTAESGGMGLTDEASVAAQEAGAASLIAHLGIADLPRLRVRNPVWFDRSEVMRAAATGLWYPAVEKMQTVAAGTLLGRVRDPFGKELQEVRAPFAGEVLYVVGTPPATRRRAAGLRRTHPGRRAESLARPPQLKRLRVDRVVVAVELARRPRVERDRLDGLVPGRPETR